MRITEAIEKRHEGKGIRRECWPDDFRLTVYEEHLWMTIRNGCQVAPWNPRYEDLTATDWALYTSKR